MHVDDSGSRDHALQMPAHLLVADSSLSLLMVQRQWSGDMMCELLRMQRRSCWSVLPLLSSATHTLRYISPRDRANWRSSDNITACNSLTL